MELKKGEEGMQIGRMEIYGPEKTGMTYGDCGGNNGLMK